MLFDFGIGQMELSRLQDMIHLLCYRFWRDAKPGIVGHIYAFIIIRKYRVSLGEIPTQFC